MPKSTIFTILSVICCSLLLSADVNLSLDGSNLNYTSATGIAGWQFSHDGCASSVSGGDTAASGMTISCGGTTCLAFSFSGGVIPAGSGTLVNLGGECTTDGLSGFVFSGSGGSTLSYEFSSGCDDEIDCAGECGGSAVEDCGGVCNGPNEADGFGGCCDLDEEADSELMKELGKSYEQKEGDDSAIIIKGEKTIVYTEIDNNGNKCNMCQK